MYPSDRVGRDAEVGERGDQHVLEPAYVRDDIALPRPPLGERHDRVAHQLPGPVIRDIAAPIGDDELGTHRRRLAQDVLPLRARTERVHVRVLLQQQVLVFGVLVHRALQRLGVAVRDEPEPPHLQ